MGNCCHRCFSIYNNKRQYLRTRYNIAKDFSIEFQNLMDTDINDEIYSLEPNSHAIAQPPLSERELELLRSGDLHTLVKENELQQRQEEFQLAAQEEELRREEEAYFSARREAALAAKQNQQQFKSPNCNERVSWPGSVKDDDFQLFISASTGSNTVRNSSARSNLKTRTPAAVAAAAAVLRYKQTEHVDNMEPVEMDWDHEPDMKAAHNRMPQEPVRSATEEDLLTRLKQQSVDSAIPDKHTAVELEWEHTYDTETGESQPLNA